MTKGDTARFTIQLVDLSGDKSAYQLSDKDEVYFIMTKYPIIVDIQDLDKEDSCIFYKKGHPIIITPQDMKSLDIGLYYYQVRVLLYDSGDLNTIIEPEEFHVTPIKGWY